MRPPKSDIKKWINALRSGEYKQTGCFLERDDAFCCLGVACKVFIPKEKLHLNGHGMLGHEPVDQPAAPAWLKSLNADFTEITGRSLVGLNDSGARSWNRGDERFNFNEIADVLQLVYIEEAL